MADVEPGHWCRECWSYAAWFPGASCDQCAARWLPPSPPAVTHRREPEQLPAPVEPEPVAVDDDWVERPADGLPTLRTGFYLVEGVPDRRTKRYLIEDEDYA